MKHVWWILFIIILACEDNTQSPLVARVGEYSLTTLELSQQIPDGLSHQDSTDLAEDFTDRWIKHKLYLEQAKKASVGDHESVTNLVEDYRESLLVHYFEEKVANDLVDTIVTEEELLQFYTQNESDFILERPIYEFWVLSTGVRDAKVIKDLEEEMKEAKEPIDISLPDSTDIKVVWLDASSLLRRFGIVDISATFDDQNEVVLTQNEDDTILLKWKDQKDTGDIAPFSDVSNEIKKSIIEERKIVIIQDVKNQIYQEALKNNSFKKFEHD